MTFKTFSVAISSETLEIRPALLIVIGDMQSLAGFSVTPKGIAWFSLR